MFLIPFFLQALALGFDEIWFHRRRGLPLWEKIGHPIDTFTVLLCIGYALSIPYSKKTASSYALLAALSCLMVTKDEFIHKDLCCASEHWLHAILFLLHPIVLFFIALIWRASQGVGELANLTQPRLRFLLICQFNLITIFMFYQIIYWNFFDK